VLIKNADSLERFEKVDTLVVDKSGTLTEGKPRLTSLVAAPGPSESEVVQWLRVSSVEVNTLWLPQYWGVLKSGDWSCCMPRIGDNDPGNRFGPLIYGF
jgi:hypothetical protein